MAEDRTKTMRRTGYALLALATIALTVPMMIGAFGGASRGEIYDPYSGKRYEDPEKTCMEDAERLVKSAGEVRSPSWEDPYRSWKARCAETHPGVHQLLEHTRAKLKVPVPARPKK